MKTYKRIFIFTNTGGCFKFENVVNFTHTTNGFEFDYYGLMSEETSHAVFNNTATCGYSYKLERVRES